MKRCVIRLAIWALRRYGYRYLNVTPEITKYAHTILPEVIAIDKYIHSGEWKRHQMYARLIKMFPESPRDDLALALELAVRRMKGKSSWL